MNCKDDRKWKLRLSAEDGNPLRNAIFQDFELIFRQPANWRTVFICDRRKDINQVNVDLERRLRIRLLRRGLLRNTTKSSQKLEREEDPDQKLQFDLPSFGFGTLCRSFLALISSGKGSPSAQTAPSVKCSFFQMGTVRLRVSIAKRQASKAAPRWAEATTIRTLVSPISSRPRR